MKGIILDANLTSKLSSTNYDASAVKFEKEKGVCVITDSKQSKGILSEKWAKYLCSKTTVEPMVSLKGLKLFLDQIWEEFYEEHQLSFNDNFLQNAFESQGSFSTYTACWFSQEKTKTYYQWLSYGNSAVLIYDEKKDELFVPEYKTDILGFLNNKGLVNWKEDNLSKKYLLTEGKIQFKPHTKIILATDAMAEHLALTYLIIKSKDEDYWNQLSDLMKSNKKLSDLIYSNRDAFSYNSFSAVLKKWKEESKKNTINQHIKLLQQKGQIAEDDITMQVVSYNPNGKEFTTLNEPVKAKTKKTTPLKIVKPPIVKPNIKPTFKSNKNKFIDVIKSNGITKLYHFTDRRNLDMIIKMGGLYSWDHMEKNNKNIPYPGGGNLSRMLDARYGLEDYVRTSFCPNHPMMFVAQNEGRIPNPIILEIDPAVVALNETLFSNMNATKKGHKKGGSLNDLIQVNFNVCLQRNHFDLDSSEKPYYQAEVMVKNFIPLKYIKNLNNF